MITHAYVRYKDDRHLAIVPVDDIKNFNSKVDYSTSFHMVKWTDATGTCAYYRARILQVGESEEDLKTKITKRRVRVKPVTEDASSEDDASDGDVAPSKEEKHSDSRERLLKILERKKRATNAPSLEQENKKLHKRVAELEKKIASQEDELKDLRDLNRSLQHELLREIRNGSSGYKGHTPVEELPRPGSPQLPSPGSPLLSSPASTQPERLRTPSPHNSPVKPPTGPSNGSTIDIGQGLHIPSEAWRRVQAREKDSMFVKDLLVSIWDPAQLQGRSIQGKHCPRFPDRPRKEPLTPWKVSVMQSCYKRRLEKQGYPPNAAETLLKRMNHYVGEKVADIDKLAKRMKRE